jgi:DNA-binding CsgD family transcriptional regulator
VADAELLSRAFVELGAIMVDTVDPGAVFRFLASRSVALFGAAEAGVMLGDDGDRLQLCASSSERVRSLELFELQADEGPCLDAHRRGARAGTACLDEARSRWPRFAPAAAEAGFGAAMAFPMCARGDRVGALNLFLTEAGELSPGELVAAQALADVATVGILHERSASEARRLAREWEATLGAAAHAADARASRRTTGTPAARMEQLTRQERRVALAVARGASNREAAAALLISARTVEAHLSHIYQKLGVRSRSQLALRLLTGEGSTLGDGNG